MGLHITDMSWGRVKHPSTILNLGDEIEVKILKFDQEKERVSLGLSKFSLTLGKMLKTTIMLELKFLVKSFQLKTTVYS